MRVTLSASAIGIIAARAFTHSILVTLVACLIVGLIIGALLRMYTGPRR